MQQTLSIGVACAVVSCTVVACGTPDARMDAPVDAADGGTIDAGARDAGAIGDGSAVFPPARLPCAWREWTVETADDEPHVANWMSVAVDRRGVVHVGYDGSGDLRYARRAVDGTWTRTIVDDGGLVSDFTDETASVGSEVSIAVVGDERVLLSHIDGTHSDLEMTLLSAGESETATWAFEDVRIELGGPRALAVADDGHVAACYGGRPEVGPEPVMRCVEGPASGPLEEVAAPPMAGWAGASLRFDTLGALFVAYRTSGRDTRLARRDQAGVWRDDHVDSNTRSFNPAVDVDVEGLIYVAYPSYHADGNRLRLARRAPGDEGWDYLDPLEADPGAPAVNGQLALAVRADVIHVVYAAEESHEPIHVVGTWAGGFAWSRVPVAARFDLDLDFAMDPEGTAAHVVFRGADKTLQHAYRRCD